MTKSLRYDSTKGTIGSQISDVSAAYATRIVKTMRVEISYFESTHQTYRRKVTGKHGTVNTFLRDGAYVTDPVLVDSGATYTPGISERRGTTTTYLHSGLKNAFAQSGAAQTLAAVREYDAFGNVTSSSGAWAGPFGYAGKFGYQSPSIPGTSTPDEGLTLMGHRYYDPSTGRFLTRDPIFDGRNWYSYGGNDPINGADPWGLAKIYVAWRPVAGVGNHVYLIIVDEDTGDTWTIGGGPAGSGVKPGDLIDHSGPAGQGNYEGIKPGVIPPGAVLIRDDDLPGQFWYDKGNNIGGEIEAKDIPYNPLTTNSNAFLYTILKRAGLLDEWLASGHSGDISSSSWTIAPGGAVWAPGWETVLPR